MESKDKITVLMGAGFSLDEALDLIGTAGTADPEQVEDSTEDSTGETVPEAEPETESSTSTIDLSDVTAAIEDLKKTVQSLTEVTRANARLYGVGEKSAGESAEDILSHLG